MLWAKEEKALSFSNTKINTSGLNKKGSFQQAKKSKERQAYFLIAPQIIGFFVFSLYPIIWVFRYAFYDYDGITEKFIGLENFIRIFTRDLDYWWSVVNTIIIAYGKLIVEIPLALIVSLLLSSKLTKCRKVFSVGFYLPNVTGVAVNCMIFTFLFSTFNGAVNNLLTKVNLISEPINWFAGKWSAMTVIIIHSLWSGFAANVLLFMAGIQNISDDVMEAASIDGANSVQTFFKITLPMLAPVIRTILMLAMVNGMKIMNPVLLLTNGGPAGSTDVVMLRIYKQFFDLSLVPQYGYASTMGAVTTCIIGILTIIYLKISKKADSVY